MNRLARVYGDHFYRSMYNPQPGTGHLVFPAVGDWVLEQMQSMKARSRLREKEKAEGIQVSCDESHAPFLRLNHESANVF